MEFLEDSEIQNLVKAYNKFYRVPNVKKSTKDELIHALSMRLKLFDDVLHCVKDFKLPYESIKTNNIKIEHPEKDKYVAVFLRFKDEDYLRQLSFLWNTHYVIKENLKKLKRPEVIEVLKKVFSRAGSGILIIIPTFKLNPETLNMSLNEPVPFIEDYFDAEEEEVGVIEKANREESPVSLQLMEEEVEEEVEEEDEDEDEEEEIFFTQSLEFPEEDELTELIYNKKQIYIYESDVYSDEAEFIGKYIKGKLIFNEEGVLYIYEDVEHDYIKVFNPVYINGTVYYMNGNSMIVDENGDYIGFLINGKLNNNIPIPDYYGE